MDCVYKIDDDDCTHPPGHFKLSLTATTMVLIVCASIIISIVQFKFNEIELYEKEGGDEENSAFAGMLKDQELVSKDPESIMKEQQRELLSKLLELDNELEFVDLDDDINAALQEIEPMRHEDDEIGDDYGDYDFGDEEEEVEEEGEEELAEEEENENLAADEPTDNADNEEESDTEANVTENIGGQGGDKNDEGGDKKDKGGDKKDEGGNKNDEGGDENNDNKGQNIDGGAKN